MLDKKPIDNFLPMRFKAGGAVKQFSKPCIKCGNVLQASQMQGTVRLIDDHIALAAEALCPKCSTRFGVACVIDNEKRVRRVALPAFLFGWYLRLLPLQPGEMNASVNDTLSGKPTDPAASLGEQAVIAAPPPPPAVDYPRSHTSLGQYLGKPIPSYIIVAGREIPFDRIALDGRYDAGEYLLDGCLIYKPR